ncbi:MAG: ABC transporter permease [Nocardioidaceae bacterium]
MTEANTETVKTATGAVEPEIVPMSKRVLSLVARYWLLCFLIIEIVIFAIISPDTFPTTANAQALLLQNVVPLVAALALMLPLIVGEFDMSIGAIVTVGAVVAAGSMRAGTNTALSILAALVVAGLVGVINSIIVSRLQVTSLIATLGVATVLGGIINEYTQGLVLNRGISPWLIDLAPRLFLNIPILSIFALLVAVVVWVVLEFTVFGRQLVAIGANRKGAQLLGLRDRTLVALTFVIAGCVAALAGVLQVSIEAGANPTSAGFPLVVTALTAVYLGATCFKTGHFNTWGTLVGVLFLAVGTSGLSLAGLAAWVQDVFTGTSLIVALGMSVAFRRVTV